MKTLKMKTVQDFMQKFTQKLISDRIHVNIINDRPDSDLVNKLITIAGKEVELYSSKYFVEYMKYQSKGIDFESLSKKEKFILIREDPFYIFCIGTKAQQSCSIKLQIFAIRQSGYDKIVIASCTGLRSFPEKIIQEILDNLTIKDIIE